MWESELSALSDDELAKLGRREELGAPFNFDEVVEKIRTMIRILEVVDQNQEFLDPDYRNSIDAAIKDVVALRADIVGFDPTAGGDPAARRAAIIDRANQALTTIRRYGVPVMGVTAGLDLGARKTEADQLLAGIDAQAKSVDAIYKATQAKGDAIVGKRLADYYEAQGTSYGSSAVWALVGALVAVIAVALVALNPGNWFGDDVVVDTASANALVDWLVTAGPRVVLGGLGLYALRFFVRLYSVNRHLQAVNLHRRNALDTWVLYTQRTPPPETAEAQIVLTALAGAIFRDPETGFVAGSSESIELGPVKIG